MTDEEPGMMSHGFDFDLVDVACASTFITRFRTLIAAGDQADAITVFRAMLDDVDVHWMTAQVISWMVASELIDAMIATAMATRDQVPRLGVSYHGTVEQFVDDLRTGHVTPDMLATRR